VEDWSPDGRWIVSLQGTHEQPGPVGPVKLRIVLLPLSAAPKAGASELLVTSSRSPGSYEGIYEVRLPPAGPGFDLRTASSGMISHAGLPMAGRSSLFPHAPGFSMSGDPL
jgi:hypothetical protein